MYGANLKFMPGKSDNCPWLNKSKEDRNTQPISETEQTTDNIKQEKGSYSEWVSVHKGVPALGEWVLLYNIDEPHTAAEIGCLHADGMFKNNAKVIVDRVTHWTVLPPVPSRRRIEVVEDVQPKEEEK